MKDNLISELRVDMGKDKTDKPSIHAENSRN